MEYIIGFLLGTLQLFYPLLIVSVLLFVYALFIRSWKLMLLSGVLLLPDAIFFSMYPPYPYVAFVPLIHVLLAFFLYKKNPTTSS